MSARRLAAPIAACLGMAATAGAASSTVVNRTGRSAERIALREGTTAWRDTVGQAIRGLTVGPIESSLHPNKGYGSDAYARTVDEAVRLGATWVSLTVFGRVWDLEPTGVSPTFEEDAKTNRRAVLNAITQAHAAGLRVLLVPHLWVETGGWRATIDPPTGDGWKRWAAGYQRFVLDWARVAETAKVDLFSVGVELRSWVTTTHAPSFVEVIHAVRRVYSGRLTYAANWDDVEDTVILGELDVIGINAFFPLAEKKGATWDELARGGEAVRERVKLVAEGWQKPVLFTEIGYTTRTDPAFEPWTWPDAMTNVTVDQRAQAEAYTALLAPLLDEPWFVGAFVWRVYADPDDLSQEAEWGFSPRGKAAELVLREAFRKRWGGDGPKRPGDALVGRREE